MHFFDPKNVLVFYGEDRFNICFLLNFFEKEKDKLDLVMLQHKLLESKNFVCK